MFSKKDKKKVVSLFDQKTFVPDQVRPLITEELFIETFKAVWEDTTELVQRNMMIYAGEVSPEVGIKVVIEKFRSIFYRRCEYTEDTLGKIINSVKTPFGHLNKMSTEDVEQSSKVAALIYGEISLQNPEFGEIRRYMTFLASMGGCGFHYIWKFFISVPLPLNDFLRIVNSFPMAERLVFIHHYTTLGISIRRRFFDPLKKVLETVKIGASHGQRNTAVKFFAVLFDIGVPLDPVFLQPEYMSRIGQCGIKNIKINNIDQLKALILFNRTAGYAFCKASLSGNKNLDMAAVLDLLYFAGKEGLEPDMDFLKSVQVFIRDGEPRVVIPAFKVLVAFKIPDIGPVVINLIAQYPKFKSVVCNILADMDMYELTRIMSYMDGDPERRMIRAQIILVTVRRYLLGDPEKLLQAIDMFDQHVTDSERQGTEGFKKDILAVLKKERLALAEIEIPEIQSEPDLPKGFFDGFFSKGGVKTRAGTFPDDGIIIGDFKGGLFKNQALDLTEREIKGADFQKAVFLNINVKDGQVNGVSFRDARMENVVMENVVFDSVSFANAFLWNVSFKNCEFNRCVFSGTLIVETSFKSSRMGGSSFIGSRIKKTKFSGVDLEMSSFAAAAIDLVHFNQVNLLNADFSAVRASLCEFIETDKSVVAGAEHAQLKYRTNFLSEIKIPPCLYGQAGRGPGVFDDWFAQLMGFMEMDRQAKLFIAYNASRIESAIDALRASQKYDQADLFELVPFLIDSNIDLLPDADFKGEAPSGIFGYSPTNQVCRVAKQYAGKDSLMLKNFEEKNVGLPTPGGDVQGLFTIGSTGSIAQTTVSDIDYWVCIDREQLGVKKTLLLNQKLSCLTSWAKDVFDKEIHFFQVDLSEVRENNFGETDYESSGSAQGRILKEEFYRTMIHVGGKIPFWCLYPSKIGSAGYMPFYNAAAPHLPNIFDLGNVTGIPAGEYGGAYLWQFIKSLKSPFKSLIKMALLEKYLQGEDSGNLLCDLLKERWRAGLYDPLKADAYLLLFEEISAYFKKNGLGDEETLIRRCFFLKLAIESLDNLSRSPMTVRKRLLDKCISDLHWKRSDIEQFGHFGDWSFEQVKDLAVQIKNYMHKSYGKLLKYRASHSETDWIISSEDLSVLGRKVDVHFTSKPFKIEKIPLVTHERVLFYVLYFRCYEKRKGMFVWEVSYRSKRRIKRGDKDDYEVVCERRRLEEVVAWLIHNSLYSEEIKLVLRPNPTPVDHRDILELFSQMYKFFNMQEEDSVLRSDLLEKPRVLKLYLVVNFTMARQLETIREYAVIYTNSWGETFSRAFKVKKNLPNIGALLSLIEQQFNMDFEAGLEPGRFGYYVPWAASKRIAV